MSDFVLICINLSDEIKKVITTNISAKPCLYKTTVSYTALEFSNEMYYRLTGRIFSNCRHKDRRKETLCYFYYKIEEIRVYFNLKVIKIKTQIYL